MLGQGDNMPAGVVLVLAALSRPWLFRLLLLCRCFVAALWPRTDAGP